MSEPVVVNLRSSRDKRAEWRVSLGRLQAHSELLGRLPRQRERDAAGNPTGRWLFKQKERWVSLDEEQQSSLSALPGFALDAREAAWDDMLETYRAYVEEHGESPSRDAQHNGKAIGAWLRDVERGRKHNFSPERQAQLRQAGIW